MTMQNLNINKNKYFLIMKLRDLWIINLILNRLNNLKKMFKINQT